MTTVCMYMYVLYTTCVHESFFLLVVVLFGWVVALSAGMCVYACENHSLLLCALTTPQLTSGSNSLLWQLLFTLLTSQQRSMRYVN